MCPKCGTNSSCNCNNYEPFCSTCFKETDCEVKYNAKCVVYNYKDPAAINKLTCLGLPNGVSVHTFMERVDQEFCYLKSCEFVDYILNKIKTCGLEDKLCDLTCDCDCGTGNCTATYIITGGTLPNALTNTPYSHTITLGGTAPFVLQNIVKPAWLTISLTGNTITFSGTPTVAGTVSVAFDISNCAGAYLYNYIGSITIASNCISPYIISGNLPDGVDGIPYSAAYQFGGTATMVLAVVSKPSWMTISTVDNINVLISGSPVTGDIGTNIPVSFTMTNACGTYTVSEFINIYAAGGTCISPSAITYTSTNTSQTSANFTVSWTNVIGVTGQELWYAKVSDFLVGPSPAPPATGWVQVSGITSTSTGATVNGLQTNTEYLFAVRSNCGAGNGPWVYKKVFSLSCPILTVTSSLTQIDYSLDIAHPTEFGAVMPQFSVLLRDPHNGNANTCISKHDLLQVYSSPTTGSFTGLTPPSDTGGYSYEEAVVLSPTVQCCPTCPVEQPCVVAKVSTSPVACPPCTLEQEEVIVSNISDVGFTVSVTSLGSGSCNDTYSLVITQGVTVIVNISGLTGPYVFTNGIAGTEYTITVVKDCCCNNSSSYPISQTGNTSSFAGTTCAWIDNTTVGYNAGAVMHTLSSMISYADIDINPIPNGSSLTLTNGLVIAKCNTNCCILDCFNFPIVSQKLSTDAKFKIVYNPSSGYNYQIVYNGPTTTITGNTTFTATFSCI